MFNYNKGNALGKKKFENPMLITSTRYWSVRSVMTIKPIVCCHLVLIFKHDFFVVIVFKLNTGMTCQHRIYASRCPQYAYFIISSATKTQHKKQTGRTCTPFQLAYSNTSLYHSNVKNNIKPKINNTATNQPTTLFKLIQR